LGLYETRLNYLKQIENYYIDDEETQEGFSTVLNKMFNALDTLKNNAGDVNVRQSFIGTAQNFATYFNSVSTGLSDIQSNANAEIKTTVENINSIAEKISVLNKEINTIEIQGGYANELRDERALLIDELSAIVPTEATETPVIDSNDPDRDTGANYYVVKIASQVLVDTYDYQTLTCVARENKVNQTDNEGLYNIVWTKTGNSFNGGADYMSGSLKALFDIRDGNNGENFTGTAHVSGSNKTITITNPSINTVEAMTMPETGTLTMAGKSYEYTSFSCERDDATGEITSYTFTLKNGLTDTEISKINGTQASIGTAVNSMGIPYYMAQMNEFIRAFAKEFNNIINYTENAEDLNGNSPSGYAFFTGTDTVTGQEYFRNDKNIGSDKNLVNSEVESYYKLTAANFCVSDVVVNDPSKLATTAAEGGIASEGVDAYDLITELQQLKSNKIIYRSGYADGFLKCIISDISVDTQESEIFEKNFENIANTIENQRLSISGVDEDEEALDLVKFQNAYNLSSKMISVMAELYDKLIEETGVV
jgi:flagellar hook-associated protein 1 FlgK